LTNKEAYGLSRKRGNGEGSITKRKDGRWMARYTVHTASGRKRKTIYGKTRAEVAEKLIKAMADSNGGVAFDAENLTLAGYLKHWLEDSVRSTVKVRTYETYWTRKRNYVDPYLGHVKLEKLAPTHLEGLYARLLEEGYSTATVRQAHSLISAALRKAVRWGLVGRNAAEAADPPRLVTPEIVTLSREEVRALLEASRRWPLHRASDPPGIRPGRYEALVTLAVTTGLRQGELLGLRWSDVDLDRGVLKVRRTVDTRHNYARWGTPKSGAGRSARLTRLATEALRRHHKRQAEERLALGTLFEDQGLVFPNLSGGVIIACVLHRSFKALLRYAGLPDVRFHALRHTAATLMLEGNVNPRIVQEMLGHANIRQTMDTYSHVLPNMQVQAAERVDELLG
jgi:integrase